MSESKVIDVINPEEVTIVLNEKATLPAVIQQSAVSEGKKAPAKEESPDKDKTAQDVEEQPNSDTPQLVATGSKKGLTNKEVTDHTAVLWKYLPIPTDEPEPAPEYLQCDTTLPGGRVIAARVRGKKHKHEGTNCDDWFEIANVDDVTFIAVSDGAGSKKFSRIGARESCKASVGYLVSTYGKVLSENSGLREELKEELSTTECIDACGKIANLVQKSVIQAREAVESAFYSRATDPAYSKTLKRALDFKDLSGTLLVAAIIPLNIETKEHLIVTCQVGDGMIVSVNSKGSFQSSIKLLGIPDSGDFSGETEFLTAPQMKTIEALQKRTKLSRGTVDTVMLMSDGVADDYYPNETQMRRLFFDLQVNQIIEMESKPTDFSKLTSKEISVFKKIPDPILYPWVNDKNVSVPIQYTNRICDAMSVSLEDLWEDRSILGLASLELKKAIPTSNMGERLRVWLDNYYERGSFDDRTLVVMQL